MTLDELIARHDAGDLDARFGPLIAAVKRLQDELDALQALMDEHGESVAWAAGRET